ncbi:MAG: Holliday junction branch migration protein RuvA [Acidobacteriales bacterium]|nr:Holliday junction branch migration protein RuvA [Terriglobales bacterium]
MIVQLRGTLLMKRPTEIVVDVQGVGYGVLITIPTYSALPEAGNEVRLHIHTHVREDVLALYGFVNAPEKQLFEKLLTVTGIGPRLAVTIMSGIPVDDLVSAIRSNNSERLTRVPGIGKKIAERMLLELRDKTDVESSEEPGKVPGPSLVERDVLSALENLGYSRNLIEKGLAVARKQAAAQQSFDTLFRAVLNQLS